MKLNRRGLFGAIAVLIPTGAVATVPVIQQSRRVGIRVSMQQGDIGARTLAELEADNKKVKVFLDDVEQRGCITADEVRGYIVRWAKDKNGNILVNRAAGEVIYETVHGDVRIEIT